MRGRDFEQLVEQALAELPLAYRRRLRNVVLSGDHIVLAARLENVDVKNGRLLVLASHCVNVHLAGGMAHQVALASCGTGLTPGTILGDSGHSQLSLLVSPDEQFLFTHSELQRCIEAPEVYTPSYAVFSKEDLAAGKGAGRALMDIRGLLESVATASRRGSDKTAHIIT